MTSAELALCFSLTPRWRTLLARLDEGAADIVRADDAELERNARFLAEADRGGNAAVGDGHDIVGLDRSLADELGADVLAYLVDRCAVDDRIGPREIDMLEDAGLRIGLVERPERADAAMR